FPKEDALRVNCATRLMLVAVVEVCAVGDPASFAIKPRKAPTLTAEPADVFVRVAPAGKLPVENPDQIGAVEHVIAGAVIVMTEDRLDRRWNVGLEPTDAPFEDRPRDRMPVEIGAELGELLGRPDLLARGQKGKIGAGRTDRVDAREFSAQPLGNCGQR